MDSVMRLEKVEIQDLKNVVYGEINLSQPERFENQKADIVGIYGQNGSGKTTLVNALSILKYLLMGRSIPPNYINYIACEKETSELTFYFRVKTLEMQSNYRIIYTCTLGRMEEPIVSEVGQEDDPIKAKMVVQKEKLQIAGTILGKKYNRSTLADTSIKGGIIANKSREKDVFDINTMNNVAWKVTKLLSLQNGTSFLFSNKTIQAICSRGKHAGFVQVFCDLVTYGMRNLFVITEEDAGLIASNYFMPIPYRIQKENQISAGYLSVVMPVNRPQLLTEESCQTLKSVVKTINMVLGKIIPNLQVEIHVLSTQLMENNEKGVNVQLVSVRDGRRFPLVYEANGIKKIICTLNLLVALFHAPSLTVVIDELDSGVFEYLLGELLSVIQDYGKGQLIFTSHNLRPLEKLDAKTIWFTSMNAQKRYKQISIQPKGNLRDTYFREIFLGGDEDDLYQAAQTAEIVHAFKKAGKTDA